MSETFPRFVILSLLLLALGLVGCASPKQTALVDDPDARRTESTIPWNAQEDWEVSARMPATMRGSSDE